MLEVQYESSNYYSKYRYIQGTKANESGEAVKLVAEEAGLEVVFMRALPLDREVCPQL